MHRLSTAAALRAGQTLIGMLFAIAIILTLAVAFLYPRGKGDGNTKGKSMPAQVKDRAESIECQNNLRQIRMAVQMNTMAGEPAPASLKELNYPAESLRCPIGKQPYRYDPKTGRVQCPYPGHERY